MNVKQLAEEYSNYMIEKRRWFHEFPELSREEENTTNAIVAELEEMGLEVARLEGIYGCVGTLKGAKLGPTVMLRADIDALPVKEKTILSFSSKTKGMHACGHDAHMAILLGTAKILSKMKDEIQGTVKFLFQPGEEAVMAGEVVKQGVTKDVDACFGMHVTNLINSGHFNIESGERMAAADKFKLTVHGSSAHGATPQLGKDAIVIAASIISDLQTIVSRTNDPLDPLVLTLGTIAGGKRYNIIPDKVEIEGTVRYYNRDIRTRIESIIKNMSEKIADAHGGSIELEYTYLTGPIINDNDLLVRIAQDAGVKLYGKDFLLPLKRQTIGEDFSYFMESVPSIYGFLGIRSNEVPGSDKSLHQEEFTIDEEALRYGAAMNAQFALDFLAKEN